MRGGFDLDGHERDPTYSRSARRHCEAQQRERLSEWIRFHHRQIEANQAAFLKIAEHHKSEIRKAERMLGIENIEEAS